MNRIRLLPDHVANQIAAGEVVERPSSVVKELVENSLDAGATRITVEIGAGGRSLLRITDDGMGMSRDDALMCLERHATSKLQRAEDLAAVTTMGFRGEALPSIASVSRFVLTTRERDDATGEATQVIIQGGKILEVKLAASAAGTTVEVRSLFFNLPARRKFLRSEETERAHIQHYLTLAALAHPEVGLTFITDGRVAWQLPPGRCGNTTETLATVRDRLRQLSGGDLNLIPVEFESRVEEAPGGDDPDAPAVLRETSSSHFRLWGLIGAPGVSRSTREEQHLFVNRRPVENRGLNFALMEGYHTALMKGRYPVCCLFLEIDPAAVDVNIHPAKREIRFREEGAVRRLVARAVRETLLQYARAQGAAAGGGAGSGNPNDGRGEGAQPARSTELTPPRPAPEMQQPGLPWTARRTESPVVGRAGSLPTPPSTPSSTSIPTPTPIPVRMPLPLSLPPSVDQPSLGPTAGAEAALGPDGEIDGTDATRATAAPDWETPASGALPERVTAAGLPLLSVPLRVVGVVGRLYVVLQSDRGLVLMDQHAAHERILFEQMLARLETASQAPSQRLLLPETVELSVRDAEFLRRQLDILNRLGVSLREFGERTFLLDALPPFVKAGSPRQFALDLVDALKAAGAGVNTLRLGEDMVAKTVCRHAVKANDPLQGRELERLVADLRACAMPYTCPHGRPTLIEMGWRELERRFGRSA